MIELIVFSLIAGVIIGIGAFIAGIYKQDKARELQQKQKQKDSIKSVTPEVTEEIIEEPQYDITTFHIAGVTFKDGRESRQTSLRMLKFKDAPMDGAILFEFEQYEYEGKPAVKILANNRVLGNVPADIVDEFIYKMTTANDYDINYEVLGGGQFSYGCVMTFIWR